MRTSETRLYPISYLSEETLAALDQDDASVEDWEEAVGEPALTPLDFDLDSGHLLVLYDQYDPGNLDFRIWLGWTRDGKIYVTGQFADNVYFNEYGSDPISGFGRWDHIDFKVDGDHSGGPYWFDTHGKELEGPLESNMQAQSYEAISYAAGDPLVDLPETTLKGGEWWMVQPPFAQGEGRYWARTPLSGLSNSSSPALTA